MKAILTLKNTDLGARIAHIKVVLDKEYIINDLSIKTKANNKIRPLEILNYEVKNQVLEIDTLEKEASVYYFSSDVYNKYADFKLLLKINGKLLKVETELVTPADNLKLEKFEFNHDFLNYAYYETDSPYLLVWLHGIGEGGVSGTDPRMITLANKGDALYNDLQKKVKCHVLMPQARTYFMDKDGKTAFHKNKVKKASYYNEIVKALIDDYKEKHNIKKVILAGCSNGGYMCLSLALVSNYDALIPICEAMPDKLLTNKDIKTLAKFKSYFIYSMSDPVVNPLEFAIPTSFRLLKEKAPINVAELKDVRVDGEEVNGHLSWINFFNNDCKCKYSDLRPFDFIKEIFND